MKADIVIIGGGGAGLPAALTAYEKGSHALVLEKRGIVGGNALMAEGFFAAESPAQKRLLIDRRKGHKVRPYCSFLSQSSSLGLAHC
ncbi:MAG: FAD-binding protein [Thermodesulfobacteriota bacterium]